MPSPAFEYLKVRNSMGLTRLDENSARTNVRALIDFAVRNYLYISGFSMVSTFRN